MLLIIRIFRLLPRESETNLVTSWVVNGMKQREEKCLKLKFSKMGQFSKFLCLAEGITNKHNACLCFGHLGLDTRVKHSQWYISGLTSPGVLTTLVLCRCSFLVFLSNGKKDILRTACFPLTVFSVCLSYKGGVMKSLNMNVCFHHKQSKTKGH